MRSSAEHGSYGSGESLKKSQNMLFVMPKELFSEKDAVEKKRILQDEYGMVMTVRFIMIIWLI